jgi:hypothetical protein
MLAGLGFTAKAIGNIASQIDVRDADDFKEWLEKLVTVVKGFDDLAKNFRKGTTDIWKEMSDQAAKPGSVAFAEGADSLLELADELQNYAGDEQLNRAQQLQQLANQYYESQVKYLSQLRDLQESIAQTADAQIRGMRLDLMSPDQKQKFLFGEISTAMGSLGAATNASEIDRLFKLISGDVSAIWSVAGDQRGALQARLEQILQQAQSLANTRIEQEAQRTIARNEELAAAMEKQKGLFTDLSADTASLSIQTRSAAAEMRETATSARGLGQSFEELEAVAARVSAAFARIETATASGGANVIGDIRANPSLLYAGTGR